MGDRMSGRYTIYGLFVSLLYLASPVSMHAATSPEEASIEAFHANLLAMMDEPTQAAREAFIREEVGLLFDIERIARVSLGRSWRKLDAESQAKFMAVLNEHVVATYADRFSENKGQQFELHGAKSARKGVVVHSSILPADGAAVKLDYFFSGGKVFNVAADGVSDLSLRRSDYNSVLKADGFDALILHLEQKLGEIRRSEVGNE